ncbi:LysR family transcriptional regulator [Bradyrhizobium sp. Pha-3]|uniref:LysR family transcriptional regulator n=1 Tax=Bradyrhizobium sp. Pha-3 TaxID=208375 RepID=UPI0035D46DB2
MRLGRSLKLRDLHTLTVVAELGSMAKAAAFLSITQPAVSQAIADLERFAGVRLLDRNPRGVVLTVAGEAMVARGRQALDTLDLGMRDIAFLTDGGRGVVRVGADMAFIAGGLMADIIIHLRSRHPGISVHVFETSTRVSAPEYRELLERGIDVLLGRRSHGNIDSELLVEHLMEEKLKVVTSSTHPLAARKRIDWADLTGESWILAATDSMARITLEDEFRQRGLKVPDAAIATYSMQLRQQLLTTGEYLTVMTEYSFRHGADRWGLHALPLECSQRLPVVIQRLKHRASTPVVERFLRSARAVILETVRKR